MNYKIQEPFLFISSKYLAYTNPQGAPGKGLANFLEIGAWRRSSFAKSHKSMAFLPFSHESYSKTITGRELCLNLKLTTLCASAELEWIYVIKMNRVKNVSFLLYVFGDTNILLSFMSRELKELVQMTKLMGMDGISMQC